MTETKPERTCVGCGKRAPSDTLVRVVLFERDGGATVVPDAKGGSFGRGAHVHTQQACLETACRKGFSRAFKREVRCDAHELGAAVATAFERRLAGLISGGTRAGHVEVGSDSVVEALRGGNVSLVVIAADAAAAAERIEVKRAVGEGRALVYGDRTRLAEAIGRRGDAVREGVAIIGVTNEALAREVRRAWLCAMSVPGGTTKSRENAE